MASRWDPPAEVAARLGGRIRDDEAWRLALLLAERAARLDEVPVGAVVLDAQGTLLGCGHDLKVTWSDPTAHAEIIALRQAAAGLGDWRLEGCTLYVTLEPCAMCAGAVLLSRVDRLLFAAASPKFGAVESRAELFSEGRWNHMVRRGRSPIEIVERSEALLRNYFRGKRK